ncbi:hypothetical protein EMIT0P260_30103 [Pseudomonas sp. IT-P260]
MRRFASAAVKPRRWPWNAFTETNSNPCGSEPAREGVVSVNVYFTDTPLSRAGSLPQGFCVVTRI